MDELGWDANVEADENEDANADAISLWKAGGGDWNKGEAVYPRHKQKLINPISILTQ